MLLSDQDRLHHIAEAIGLIARELARGSMGDPKIARLETIAAELALDAGARDPEMATECRRAPTRAFER